MPEYTFQKLDSSHLHKIDELFSVVFNYDSNLKLIQWKYFDNPAGNAICFGAFYGEQLVASGTMMPECMMVFNKEKTLYKSTDLMTHPDHQRKGLSKQINALLKEEVSKENPIFAYTLCSHDATKSFLKNNWTHVGKFINYFKPSILLKTTAAFKSKNNTAIKKQDTIGSALDTYPFQNDTNKISSKKTVEILKWRIQNPNFRYSVLFHYENNKVNGYLIYSIGKSNMLNIIDVDATNNNKKILNALITAAEQETVQNNCRGIVACTVNNSSLEQIAKSNNYLNNPFTKGPLISILDFNICIDNVYGDKVLDKKNWSIYALSYDDI